MSDLPNVSHRSTEFLDCALSACRKSRHAEDRAFARACIAELRGRERRAPPATVAEPKPERPTVAEGYVPRHTKARYLGLLPAIVHKPFALKEPA